MPPKRMLWLSLIIIHEIHKWNSKDHTAKSHWRRCFSHFHSCWSPVLERRALLPSHFLFAHQNILAFLQPAANLSVAGNFWFLPTALTYFFLLQTLWAREARQRVAGKFQITFYQPGRGVQRLQIIDGPQVRWAKGAARRTAVVGGHQWKPWCFSHPSALLFHWGSGKGDPSQLSCSVRSWRSQPSFEERQ